MKVFISWSGERSGRIAESMKVLLEDVVLGVEAWIAEQDIPPGSMWSGELATALNQSSFGVFCLTKQNIRASWIAFEAGALMKTLGARCVCPFLIDVEVAELHPLPFSLFQSVPSNKEGTLKLVRALNDACSPRGTSEAQLMRRFNRSWPDFRRALDEVRDQECPLTPIEQLQQELALQTSKLESMHALLRAMVSKMEPPV